MKKIAEKIKNGKFLKFVKESAPQVLDFVGDVSGVGALNKVANIISNDKTIPDDLKAKAKELYELELKELDMILEDRKDARNREIQMAASGKSDWMFKLSGTVALAAFLFIIHAVIYFNDVVEESAMFHQIIGFVEGVTVTIYNYYFGSSKGSDDKTRLLGRD